MIQAIETKTELIISWVPGPMRMLSDSRMSANSVVVKSTVPLSSTGMFIRISFCKCSRHVSAEFLRNKVKQMLQ